MGNSITLLELNRRIKKLVESAATQSVWVTAELSDVAVRGGHCYMELLQKDDRGQQVAKARGVIWASNFQHIRLDFREATGQDFATGLKVMLCVSAVMHPLYGLSLVVSAVDPQYTMGDLLRRRQEILARLKSEGVLDLNRSLPWPEIPSRIAVISAPGAAGYGDFINQLYGNSSHLRFTTRLFPAIMQGEKAPASIIAALDEVAGCADDWDCVVIIRGGGATSDLQAFEDYELAFNIAQFPLPVVIGIGHERDITVLDYVANMRVKTPTAAAEYLVGIGEDHLATLHRLTASILQSATDVMAGFKEQLSYMEGLLPVAPRTALTKSDGRLRQASMALAGISGRRVAPALERLNSMADKLATANATALATARRRLDADEGMLKALSPASVLARGYSITRYGGVAVRRAVDVPEGALIQTVVADGEIVSVKTAMASIKE